MAMCRQEVRESVLLWVGCIAGALQDTEYSAKLAAAGFEAIDIEPTRVYKAEDARAFLTGKGLDVDALASQVDGKFMSAFIRARKAADRRTDNHHASPLQRSLPLHRQFGALHHGGGDPELQRTPNLHRL